MVDVWTEVDRVLKPGAFVCAWVLPKTADLAGLAMRLVGWTVHESVLHLFGQEMSKAGCIGKQIDKAAGAEREVVGKHPNPAGNKRGGTALNMGVTGMPSDVDITAPATEAAKRWTGWHSQIAPGHEQWLIARKPSRLTYADQVQTHGCGAFNIGACRVPRSGGLASVTQGAANSGLGWGAAEKRESGWHPVGSMPRNVVLTTGGPGCPERGLDRQSGVLTSGTGAVRQATAVGHQSACYGVTSQPEGTGQVTHGDSGGASRYFTRFDQKVGYFPKASDRSVPGRPDLTNRHPTHKHPDLMRWLVRLMGATAEHTGGEPAIVLDPFAGSFTTALACVAEGVRCIAIERDLEHYDVGKARVLAAIGSPEAAAAGNEKAPEGAQLSLL